MEIFKTKDIFEATFLLSQTYVKVVEKEPKKVDTKYSIRVFLVFEVPSIEEVDTLIERLYKRELTVDPVAFKEAQNNVYRTIKKVKQSNA